MSTAKGASKNERRDLAREKARQAREAQQRRERRNRVLLQGGIAAVVIAALAIVALVLVNSIHPPGPGPKNMADDGAVVTTGLALQPTGALAAGATPSQRAPEPGKVAIRTYEDFGCPICGDFEKASSTYIRGLVESGKATLQIYPVSILDRNFQSSKYSTRAANAAAAVANFSPNRFYAFHALLYAHQPAEGSSGLTDDQLIAYAKQAGVSDLPAITAAIRNHTYFAWVADSTERFVKGSYPLTDVKSTNDLVKLTKNPDAGVGTPTIFVNGKYFTGNIGDQKAFANFVLSTGAAYTAAPTASPTASPSQAKDTPSPTPTPSK